MTFAGMLFAALVAAGVPAGSPAAGGSPSWGVFGGAAWAQEPAAVATAPAEDAAPTAPADPAPGEAAEPPEADDASPPVGADADSEAEAVAGAADAAPTEEASAEGDAASEAPEPGPGPGDPLYDRLLGDGAGLGGSAAPAPPVDIQPLTVPTWLWVVGILGISALLLLRSRSLKGLRGADAIEVVSRSQLGKDGSLAVVEVAEADGERRRLLVGFGSGAPRLVADLGRPLPALEPEPDVAPRPLPAAPTNRPRPVSTTPLPRAAPPTPEPPTPIDAAADESRAPRANAAAAWARAVKDAGGPPPADAARPQRLEKRHDLIQEILSEREDEGDGPSEGGALPFPKVRR